MLAFDPLEDWATSRFVALFFRIFSLFFVGFSLIIPSVELRPREIAEVQAAVSRFLQVASEVAPACQVCMLMIFLFLPLPCSRFYAETERGCLSDIDPARRDTRDGRACQDC